MGQNLTAIRISKNGEVQEVISSVPTFEKDLK
jgi:hypothetical protein